MFKVKINNKKIICIIILLTVIFSFLEIFINNGVKADSNRYTYNGNNLDSNVYPGYKEKIDIIRKAHPNWNIVIMETGLDWNQVVVAESAFAGSSPYSLVQGKSGAWICSSCGSRTFDNGSWYHASEATIRYYMDPRNWMDPNSSSILQFLQIGKVDSSDDDVYNAIKNTFLDKDGKGMENAKIINRVSKENNANAFYVVARIIQEQGAGGSATYKMQADGKTYYNIFNINASGNDTPTIVANALAKAKKENWDTLESCISGSIKILFADYINQKQDTIYLNKFDVESYGGLYHQYMQNIEAPKAEASLMYNKIKDTGILNQKLTFVIPVFLNMPSRNSDSPDSMSEIGPRNIRVKEGHSEIVIRESRSTSSKQIATIKDSSVTVLSIERFGDGWHKIILENGTEGYVYFNSSYLEEVSDVINCSESVVVSGSNIELKAGPGNNQKAITTLANGQILTRIDNSARYNFNGVIWDRVKLDDGRQGFIQRNSIQLESNSNNIFTIRAEGGLFLRSEPNGTTIRLLADGSKVTRIEIGTTLINGFYWDKVTTPSGATGYVARAYLRDKNGNVPSGAAFEKAYEVKKDDSKQQINAEPDVNEATLKEKFGDNIKITKADGGAISNGVIGTGCKVTIDGKTYTVVKLGDCNGDGQIDIIDMALIKRDISNKQKLANEFKKAGKISEEGTEIDIIDMALIKRYISGYQPIKIK